MHPSKTSEPHKYRGTGMPHYVRRLLKVGEPRRVDGHDPSSYL
jgi:hypothetical protein